MYSAYQKSLDVGSRYYSGYLWKRIYSDDRGRPFYLECHADSESGATVRERTVNLNFSVADVAEYETLKLFYYYLRQLVVRQPFCPPHVAPV